MPDVRIVLKSNPIKSKPPHFVNYTIPLILKNFFCFISTMWKNLDQFKRLAFRVAVVALLILLDKGSLALIESVCWGSGEGTELCSIFIQGLDQCRFQAIIDLTVEEGVNA